MVYVTSHISGSRFTWNIQQHNAITGEDIAIFLHNKEGSSDICLWLGGHRVEATDIIGKDDIVVATLQLKGGKGGFGSMLRAIGAQIEKTTNREACRDLSGRRLRDINEEKRLKDFIAKKAEKELEAQEAKKKKLAKLRETSKHFFEDKAYLEQKEKNEQNTFDSVDKAFSDDMASSSGVKRPTTETKSEPPRKKNRKMFDDFDDSSDGSDNETDDQKNVEQIVNS